MWLSDLCKNRLSLHLKRKKPRLPRAYAPTLELLEGRTCPSLLVGSFYSDQILSYNETSGAFEGVLVQHKSAGLTGPRGLVLGNDGDLYVNSGKIFAGPSNSSLLVFDGTTGDLQSALITKGGPNGQLTYGDARGLVFGPDGYLYVASAAQNNILQIDPQTGTIGKAFVPTGEIVHPDGLVFGPDWNLYVTDAYGNSVLRFEGPTSPDGLQPGTPLPSAGNTGAFFVPSASGGLDHPASVVFGPDGNLYVESGLFSGTPNVLRFDGHFGAPLPSAANSGATFVAVGSGGLSTPHGVIFGPDDNLYVSNGFSIKDKSLPGSVLRYDGRTGEFLNTFVPEGSGGYQGAAFLIFSETDPVTLLYSHKGTGSQHATLAAETTQPLPALRAPPDLALAANLVDKRAEIAPAAVPVSRQADPLFVLSRGQTGRQLDPGPTNAKSIGMSDPTGAPTTSTPAPPASDDAFAIGWLDAFLTLEKS